MTRFSVGIRHERVDGIVMELLHAGDRAIDQMSRDGKCMWHSKSRMYKLGNGILVNINLNKTKSARRRPLRAAQCTANQMNIDMPGRKG